MNEKWTRILGLVAIGVSAGLEAVVRELRADQRIQPLRPASDEPVPNPGRWVS